MPYLEVYEGFIQELLNIQLYCKFESCFGHHFLLDLLLY